MLLDACQLADLAVLRLHLLRQGPSLLLEGADVPLQALVLLHLLAQLCLAAGELPLQLRDPRLLLETALPQLAALRVVALRLRRGGWMGVVRFL